MKKPKGKIVVRWEKDWAEWRVDIVADGQGQPVSAGLNGYGKLDMLMKSTAVRSANRLAAATGLKVEVKP